MVLFMCGNCTIKRYRTSSRLHKCVFAYISEKRIGKGICHSYSILHRQHYYSLRSAAEWVWFTGKYWLFSAILKLYKVFGNTSQYLSNLPVSNGYGIHHRRDSIFPITTIEFEGKQFSAPHDADAYLTDLFKNYMEIPPVEKRQVHAVVIVPELQTS